jgi:DNA-3-methyladenine glycosylase I
LKKRDAFREAFAGFRPEIIAEWGEDDVLRLLANPGIVRHRGKIEGTIKSARAYLKIEQSTGFSAFLWAYVDGKPLQSNFASMAEVPGFTPLSTQISKDLKKAGFTFCGPTIVYAFMQATGMVNDHITGCPCHAKVAAMA